MNRTTIKIGQESKPEIRQQLIGIFAHQCHETFNIVSRPGPDDHVGAYAEIVRQVRPARIAIARAIAHRVRPDIPLSPADLAGVLVDVKDMSFVIAVCLTHRVLARSLGWFGLISGLSALVPGVVGIADPGSYLPVPFLPGLIWTLIVSILLTVRPRRPPSDAVDQMDTAKPARCGAPLRALIQNWLQLFTAFLLALAIMMLLNNVVVEEIGWRGFVFSRLQDRQGPLRGALPTTVFFWTLHVPSFYVETRSSAATATVLGSLPLPHMGS